MFHRYHKQKSGIWNRRSGNVTESMAGLFYDGGTVLTRDIRMEASSFTTDGANALTFVDVASSSHTFSAIAGQRVANPTADAAANNALGAAFTGTQLYTSSLSATDWSFGNNTPSHIFFVYKPTSVAGFQVMLETGLAGGTNAFNLVQNTTTVTTILQRASGGNQSLSQASGAAAGTAACVEIYYTDSGASPARYMKVAGNAAQTAATMVGARGDCSNTCTLGARGGMSLGMSGVWFATYAFRRLLNAQERAIMQAWVRFKFGLTI